MKFFKRVYSTQNDEQLMQCLQHGEAEAFDELYRRYSQRLLSYFYRMLAQDREKAQDFLQEIFLKIVEKPGLFHTERRFSTWLFSIANNMCKNEYRRQHVRRDIDRSIDPDTIAHYSESVTRRMDAQRFDEVLTEVLETLEEGPRSVFLLRYQEHFSIREISEALSCSEGTVKSRLFYTLRTLATKLKDFDPHTQEIQHEHIR